MQRGLSVPTWIEVSQERAGAPVGHLLLERPRFVYVIGFTKLITMPLACPPTYSLDVVHSRKECQPLKAGSCSADRNTVCLYSEVLERYLDALHRVHK